MTVGLDPGWYDDEGGARRYWTGKSWVTPVDGATGTDQPLSSARRRVPVVAVVVALCVAAVGAGAWWLVARDEPERPTTPAIAAPASTTAVPAVDDAAALDNLGSAIGALYAYAEGQTPDDCSYVAYVAASMLSATPLDSYRGTYESIQQRMANVGALCSLNPHDSLAIGEATSTRNDVVKILNDRAWLGMNNWGSL